MFIMERKLMKCRVAELNIEILSRYRYLEDICGKYAADFSSADLVLSASREDLEYEKKVAVDRKITQGKLESVAVCRKLSLELPRFDSFMLHAATFELDGRGIAFFAKSGTGKSTHMLLWKELFGEKLQIINGDKPIVRLKDGVPFAFGTPWCGKEGLSQNRSVALSDLCFIKRNNENSTRRLEKSEALKLLLEQVAIPVGSENILKLLDLLDRTISHCNLWEISCNTDFAAAKQSSSIILR